MTWQRFALTRETCNHFSIATNGSTAEVKEAVEEVKASGETHVDQPEQLDQPDQAKQPDQPEHSIADPAPPWRQFMDWDEFNKFHATPAWNRWKKLQENEKNSPNPRAIERAESFVLPETDPCRELVLAVNAALALRRPLLITGLPGSGKTTLAYAVAAWLRLGPVLEWAVSPGANLADALATYNPLARLQDLQLEKQSNPEKSSNSDLPQVENYIRLGPVGTAFLPAHLPRVLLIDEIDKGDLNLANELLNLFEEGRFPIPELQRAETAAGSDVRKSSSREVATWDEDAAGKPITASIKGGVVQCHEFPLVMMSSNGERDFPAAFNRRCLRISMPDFSFDRATLELIVRRHLVKKKKQQHQDHQDQPQDQLQKEQQEQQDQLQQVETALNSFEQAARKARGREDKLAMDQLLNFAFLLETSAKGEGNVGRSFNSIITGLENVLLQPLNADLEGGTDQ
jgi:MoxR-like ATPase